MSELKAGRHEVKVAGAQATTSQKKGTPGVLFTFEDAAGDRIEHTLWLTPNTAERAGKTMAMLGFNPFQEASWEKGYGEMIGHSCQIVVKDDEYNGRPVRRVEWINEPNSSNEFTEADAFNQAMKVFGVGKAKSPASVPEEDGDIPF